MSEQHNTILDTLIEKDFPNLGCLLDLLAEHPVIAANPTLTGSVSLIKTQVMGIWEALESVPA